jgi:hypothetical protein
MRGALTLVLLCCLLASARASPAALSPSAADLAARVASLDKRLARHGFTVVAEGPFVIVGDEPPAKVKARARRVRWTMDHLRRSFFARDPQHIVEVWLFADERSYRRGAKKYFDDEPETPYGYYSPDDRAIVMNIGPGAGTLVHELVHPYIEANFPAAPAWFNEGLASLYEYPSEARGQIVGKNNWRLRGLRRELRSGHRRSFASLCATTTDEFYAAADDTYGQARYLMYYLQEKGLLVEFYRRFLAGAGQDPGGHATLAAVLGEKDMEAFHARWVEWVLALPDP